jgi:hypothetical protein
MKFIRKTLSYLSDKTGRPKEEGGHRSRNISIDKFIDNALTKVPNRSRFIEKAVRPLLENLDPGEVSPILWEIDVYLRDKMSKAMQERKFEQVQALGWIANQLEDARRLCGPPNQSFSGTQLVNVLRSEEEHSKEFVPNLKWFVKTPTKDSWMSDPEWVKKQEYLEEHLRTGYSPIFWELQELRKLEDELWAVAHDRVGVGKEILEALPRYSKGRGYLAIVNPQRGQIELAYGPFDFSGFQRIRAYAHSLKKVQEYYSDSFPFMRKAETIDDLYYFFLVEDNMVESYLFHTDRKYFDPTEGKRDKKNKMVELFDSFSKEIAGLMLETKSGTPLKGRCPACPQN